jgi:hypothetical protein
MVIAVKYAPTGSDFELSRSFKLMPQRLQKLRPGATGVPQAEQYINVSPSTYGELWTERAAKRETAAALLMFPVLGAERRFVDQFRILSAGRHSRLAEDQRAFQLASCPELNYRA